MKSEPKIYQAGNRWQNKVYSHMSRYLKERGVVDFGRSAIQESSKKQFGTKTGDIKVFKGGNLYPHLLTEEQASINFISEEIYDATQKRFKSHKAGDLKRVLTNTSASQPYCFNLIIYLDQRPELANKLFSELLEKQVRIVGLVPEFTPNKCENITGFERNGDETIGDQKGKMGTDADIAVFYTYDDDKKGVLLIEFKFIEAEFSVCSSYKSKEKVRPICESGIFHQELIEHKKTDNKNRYLCGYNKYQNWDLTSKSDVLDFQKIKTSSTCPFRFGLNQLWRNYLLAEKVALVRQCDEFGFWVFYSVENDNYLWKNGETEKQFRRILTEQGNNHFKKIHLEAILELLCRISIGNAEDENWVLKMSERYLVK